MQLDLLIDNLLSPPILFFFLGMGAVVVRSDLEIPAPISKLFSLYLLWAIGFKGGVQLRAAGLDIDTLLPIFSAMLLSASIPFLFYPLLRIRLNRPDACATAAAYGSVSVVTFITATNFLDAQNIEHSGYLVAALALMESPAIASAIILYGLRRHLEKDNTEPPPPMRKVLHEAIFGGAVYLLLGSLVVGIISGPTGYEVLQPFTNDIFHGVLVLFLLDSGMTAARRLGDLKGSRGFAVLMAIVMPLISATLGLGVAKLLGLSMGDGFLIVILAASASYIAVPAAMAQALPKANSGLYLPMALGLTFPFNIALGIPLYLAACRAFLGD